METLGQFCVEINSLFISLLLTALFGWVIALFASFTKEGIFTPTLLWSALAITVSAISVLYFQYRADRRSGLNETLRKQRDQPVVLVHVLSAGLIFIMAGYLLNAGFYGQVTMTIAVTALFIFRDLRPDGNRDRSYDNTVATSIAPTGYIFLRYSPPTS